MKTKYLTVVASTFLALAVFSNAAVMNVTVNGTGSFLQNGTEPNGALSLASKTFYSGFQSPASTSNNRDTNFNFLRGVVANWNANRLPLLGTPVNTGATPADNGNIGGGSSFTTASGYDYVVFHFGNGPAGAGGQNDDENGWWAAWYLGGASATFSIPQEGDPLQNVGGFSSANYFNGGGTPRKVPDVGSTFLAFGIGLLGLGGVRRFLLKA